MENNIKEMAQRHIEERRLLQEDCPHNERDMAQNTYGGFFCKKCHIVMPDNYITEEEKKARREDLHRRVVDLKLEILPSGHIRFKRGNRDHNNEMKRIISKIIDEDDDVMEELSKFFKGSEDVEILVGDTIFCG